MKSRQFLGKNMQDPGASGVQADICLCYFDKINKIKAEIIPLTKS